MTDLEELEAASEALARERADHRTPAIVRRAFLPPFCALTPRRLMELEQIDSPVLSGNWPWEDAAAMAQAFCTAHAILFPDREVPPPSQMSDGLLAMTHEVNRGFQAMMPMKARQMPGMTQQAQLSDGIGWLPRLLAAAMKNGIGNPLDLPLDQLFILSAAAAANEGMECAGTDYRDREISAPGELQSASVAEQPCNDSTKDRGSEQDDSDRPEESGTQSATSEMVDAGNKQVQFGAHPHEENIA